MSEKTRSVVVSAPTAQTHDGKTHKQGAKLTLSDVEARDLLRAGVVREVDTKTTSKGA
jgi:hypothetical protein